ncbi:hypothetical protein [Streptomyces sp. NPDC020880]
MAMLVPYLEVPPHGTPEPLGAAGLRLAAVENDRFVLRRWDGHGCLVLHTDELGTEMWDQWVVVRPREAEESGRGFEPLWDRDDLCEQEAEVLQLPRASETARRSKVLRQYLLRELPVNPGLAHRTQWGVLQTGRTNPTAASTRPSEVRELSPRDLVALEGPVCPSSMGDALAHQLIAHIHAGRIRAGDVLIDHVALVTQLGGRAAAARWAQLVIEHVARRYGLLRYRRRRLGDPVGRRTQDYVWSVSEHAALMSGVASVELASYETAGA